MTDDARAEMVRRVQSLSRDELDELVRQITSGSIGDLLGPRLTGPPAIELPDPPERTSALTVRVDVDGARPPVWRRLVLHGDLTLDQVHEVLQAAMGWMGSHLHRFWAKGGGREVWGEAYFLTDFDADEGDEGIPEAEVRLDQLLRRPGDTLRYTYDFGDDWTHTIRLESVAVLDPDSPVAVCTAARRACPLEDVGGVPGHNDLVAEHRRDPSLSGLEDYLRDWVPAEWDPAEVDVDEVNQQLALIGADAEEVFAAHAARSGPAVPLPAVLEPLLELATPDVVAEVGALCATARGPAEPAPLSPTQVQILARPYRLLVEMACADGIPLTSAGWMKPVVVQQLVADLDLAAPWLGKGNRESQTVPVAHLRALCQRFGLLRKRTGRLLATRLARSLHGDEDYLRVIAGRLVTDKDPFTAAAAGLFALHVAAAERVSADHADPVASTLTRCGLRTGPAGVGRWEALELCRPLWFALRIADGMQLWDVLSERRSSSVAAVALARAALWPSAAPPPGEGRVTGWR